MIQGLDFVGVPSQDAARSRSFYVDTLGLRPDDKVAAGGLGGRDVLRHLGAGELRHGVRAAEERVTPRCTWTTLPPLARSSRPRASSSRATSLDTGVCHMAFFTDPDGNDLMLHHRYAPRG